MPLNKVSFKAILANNRKQRNVRQVSGDERERKLKALKKKLEAELLKKFENKLFQYAPACPWFIKLQADNIRRTFSTGKVNRAEAAIAAKGIYEFLQEHGMDAALKQFGENKPAPGTVTTIGDLIAKVEKNWLGQPRTFQDYATSLRRVVSETKDMPRENADTVRIADIKHGEIAEWQAGYIKRAGKSPATKARAETSSNSILRGCKALFGARLLERLELSELPNPFKKIRLPNNRDHRFQKGGVDATKLLEQAVTELADHDVEVFKTIVLALCLGLRRNEIDKCEFSMFNLEAGTLSVDNSEYLHVKSERSRGVVELEPELIPLIRGWQAKATSSFVLESEVQPKPESKYQHYRAQETFARAIAWLRAKGVKSNEPLHFCRKLYGSLICDKHGVYAASRALRHADIQTTTRHYTSRTENVLPGLGGALLSTSKVVPIKPEIVSDKTSAMQ
jgi:integrase